MIIVFTYARSKAPIYIDSKGNVKYICTKIRIMENLSLSNSCVNCQNLIDVTLCGYHKIEVSEKYTCEEFETSLN